MTSAERPTQEVAPRTELHRLRDDIAREADYPWGTTIHPEFVNGYRQAAKTVRMWVETMIREAEASRSAPPAAVTLLDELARTARAAWLVMPDDQPVTDQLAERLDRVAAFLLLSKITPAQPSASSEGDAEVEAVMEAMREGHRAAAAAKPTGSADEPLLRAALERIADREIGDDLADDPAAFDWFRSVVRDARAALASAEPAEADGDE